MTLFSYIEAFLLLSIILGHGYFRSTALITAFFLNFLYFQAQSQHDGTSPVRHIRLAASELKIKKKDSYVEKQELVQAPVHGWSLSQYSPPR